MKCLWNHTTQEPTARCLPSQESWHQRMSLRKKAKHLPWMVKGSLSKTQTSLWGTESPTGSLSPLEGLSVLLYGLIKILRWKSSPGRPTTSSFLTRDRYVCFHKSCVLQFSTSNCLWDMFSCSSTQFMVTHFLDPKLAPPLASPFQSTTKLFATFSSILTCAPLLSSPGDITFAMSQLSSLSTTTALSPFTTLLPPHWTAETSPQMVSFALDLSFSKHLALATQFPENQFRSYCFSASNYRSFPLQ